MLAGDMSVGKAQTSISGTDGLDVEQCARVEGIVLPHAGARTPSNHSAAVGRAGSLAGWDPSPPPGAAERQAEKLEPAEARGERRRVEPGDGGQRRDGPGLPQRERVQDAQVDLGQVVVRRGEESRLLRRRGAERVYELGDLRGSSGNRTSCGGRHQLRVFRQHARRVTRGGTRPSSEPLFHDIGWNLQRQRPGRDVNRDRGRRSKRPRARQIIP